MQEDALKRAWVQDAAFSYDQKCHMQAKQIIASYNLPVRGPETALLQKKS